MHMHVRNMRFTYACIITMYTYAHVMCAFIDEEWARDKWYILLFCLGPLDIVHSKLKTFVIVEFQKIFSFLFVGKNVRRVRLEYLTAYYVSLVVQKVTTDLKTWQFLFFLYVITSFTYFTELKNFLERGLLNENYAFNVCHESLLIHVVLNFFRTISIQRFHSATPNRWRTNA